MDTTDVTEIDIDGLFYDVKIKAIQKLEIDFNESNLDISDIKELMRQVERIEKKEDLTEKMRLITFFLMDNGRYYQKGLKTPLNLFFKNCTLIIKKHFQ